MEEYLEILKKFIECDNMFIRIDMLKNKDTIKAIENLIERYKELEKLVADYNERGQTLNNLMNAEGTFMYKEICKNFIPKSKVKEKIEELNDINSKFSQRVIKSKEVYLTELVQNILQELIED